MIKNDRQLRITTAKAQKLREALGTQASSTDPRERELAAIHAAGLEDLLSELDEDIKDYEALKAGHVETIGVEGLEQLPIALIRARIARNMTQKDLANALGLKEQQVQRYEATDYGSASFSTLLRFAAALGLRVDAVVGLSEDEVRLDRLLATARSAGLTPEFVEARIAGPALWSRATGASRYPGRALIELAGRLARALGTTLDRVLAGEPTQVSLATLPSFKRPSRYSDVAAGYLAYVERLADLTLRCVALDGQHRKLPVDSRQAYEEIGEVFGEVTFENALDYVWRLGIPVLPLSDGSMFHGACLRLRDRPVIVLKQRTRSRSRWAFDLLHELRHAMESSPNSGWIAVDTEPGATETDEVAANAFAGNVMLAGQAEPLAKECVARARGSMAGLKNAVVEVAAHRRIDQGALANYLAYRLSLQGENWWGTANSLQPKGEDPVEIARNKYLAEADLSVLPDSDRDLLALAVG